MKKIRILNILTGGLKRDGISLSQLDYMKLINKDIFSIDIAAVCNDSEDVIEEFKKASCKVIKFPNRKKKVINYLLKLNKVMKENKYDIVHVHGSSYLMSMELALAKHNHINVRIAHSRNTETNNLFLHKLLSRKFNKGYNVALACGEDAGKWLFNNKEYMVLHNGKDLEKYKFKGNIREKIRKEYNLKNCKALGTVGNCNDQKNQFYLIDLFSEAYKKDDSLRLFIMGDGKNRNDLEQKANDLGLSNVIFFLGRINNVHEIINGMDIMLLPSLYEGLPNVVLEWQANGLPCIISDTITKECIVSDLVYSLPINQGVSQWVNKIKDITDSDTNRNNMSVLGCKKLIENGFEIDTNTKRLEKMYINLCDKYQRGSNEKNK